VHSKQKSPKAGDARKSPPLPTRITLNWVVVAAVELLAVDAKLVAPD
jgi:hypothetical protein